MKLLKSILLLLMLSSTAVLAQKKQLYAGFPETFESPDTSTKNHYKLAKVQLKTGEWSFDQVILGGTPKRDRFNPTGKQCVRFQQNKSVPALLSMDFDLNEGASKVTLSYGSYYKDAKSVFKVEYSTDGGSTWQQAGNEVTADNTESKTAEFTLNVKGKVRFRVNKLGLGDGKADTSIQNGRLNIDDFAVYSNN